MAFVHCKLEPVRKTVQTVPRSRVSKCFFTVFKMAILQDVLLQCGECNNIFKDSDGFNQDISVSINRDDSALHVRHFGTEYNIKNQKTKKTKYNIFVCCLDDNSTIIIQTLLFFNDIVYFEYMFVIVIKIVQINWLVFFL